MPTKVCGLRSTGGNHVFCTCTIRRCPRSIVWYTLCSDFEATGALPSATFHTWTYLRSPEAICDPSGEKVVCRTLQTCAGIGEFPCRSPRPRERGSLPGCRSPVAGRREKTRRSRCRLPYRTPADRRIASPTRTRAQAARRRVPAARWARAGCRRRRSQAARASPGKPHRRRPGPSRRSKPGPAPLGDRGGAISVGSRFPFGRFQFQRLAAFDAVSIGERRLRSTAVRASHDHVRVSCRRDSRRRFQPEGRVSLVQDRFAAKARRELGIDHYRTKDSVGVGGAGRALAPTRSARD